MKFIPYGRQDITNEDIEAVVQTLTSDFITQGPKILELEKALCDYTNAKFATLVSNATAALHISCLALGIGKNDVVWTSPITFVASSNCVLYCGAEIDFVDIDPETFNISVSELEIKLKKAKEDNRLPKALICVHMAGQSCEMKKIKDLSKEYQFKIIEDASHAIGGSYNNEKVGCSTYSDISIFSFHPVKIVTTGEGGCALTNNPEIDKKLKLLRSHGITKQDNEFENCNDEYGSWYYEQQDLGFNYRMTDIQASLGLNQLKRVDSYIEKRNSIANRYNELLKDLPLSTPLVKDASISSFHLYIIQLRLNEITKTHKEVFTELREKGIGVNLHYFPVHLQPYYQKLGFKEGDFPNAEKYFRKSISIPMYPTITDEEIEYVVKSLKIILS